MREQRWLEHFEGWGKAGSLQTSLQRAHLALPALIHSAVRKQKQKQKLGGTLACIPDILKIK